MYNFGLMEETTTSLLLKHALSLLLPLLISALFLFKWIHSSSKTLKKLPPSPPKFPLIGNFHQLGTIPQRSLKSLAEKYGPVMLLKLGSKPILVISSAHAAEEVLRSHDLIFANRPKPGFARRLLYNFKDVGFAPYGEYWRRVRSICVLQLLSNKKVQSFKGVREEEISLMLEKIRESCLSSSDICISKILATLNNNIVSMVAIGKRYSEETGGSKFKDLFPELSMLVGAFNVGDYIPWLGWINHINGLEAKVTRVAKDLDRYLEKIVEEGITRSKKRVSNDGEDEDEKGHQNFIDVLLEVQRKNAIGFALGRDSIKAIILVKV